jgi:dihydrofolate synthase/folylpolyglutamate synthase
MVYLPHWPIPSKNTFTDFDLNRIRSILQKLDNPQNKLPPVIHVAGTNGKGSVIAFFASILVAAGYKTHIYTSPHLHHVNERIVIAGNAIDDGYLYEILEEIRSKSEGVFPSLFEGLTIASILAFSRNQADICLIETGMGGRVDATNIIDNKILTIITSISLDHTEFLGNNLAAIAAEKSYIMRKNIPAIIAPQDREAGAMLEIRALEIDAPLIHAEDNFNFKINSDKSFDFFYKNIILEKLPQPGLEGNHQYLNAALAIAGILTIKNFKINEEQIAQGLKQVKWPSRIEKINNNLNKLLKNKESEIWIDGAHNTGGAFVLANWIKSKNDDKLNYLITGFTKNKSKTEFFQPFKNIINYICAVRVEGEPNPENSDIIKTKIKEAEIIAEEQDDLIDAINFLVNLNPDKPCRIVITGSLYLARDVKKSNLILQNL